MDYVEYKVWSFDKELEEEEQRYKAIEKGLSEHYEIEALINMTSNYNIISKRIVD